MHQREDDLTRVEQTLTRMAAETREREAAPRDLWARIASGLDAPGPTRGRGLTWFAWRGAMAAAAVSALLVAAVFLPGQGTVGPATASASEILERAYLAMSEAPSPRLESVIARMRHEIAVFEGDVLEGPPAASDVTHQRAWWRSPTQWRVETEMEYQDPDVGQRPGTLLGGVALSDGESLWLYSNVVPGRDPYTGEEVEPRVYVEPRPANFDLSPGMMLSFIEGPMALPALLANFEECFVADLEGTGTVAGRETHVVRLLPREPGKVVQGPLDAGSCHAMLGYTSAPGGHGSQVAPEQSLTLWVDTEYALVLKVVHIVEQPSPPVMGIERECVEPDECEVLELLGPEDSRDEGMRARPPGSSIPEVDWESASNVYVTRSEVLEIEFGAPIPEERLRLEVPAGVPVQDRR